VSFFLKHILHPICKSPQFAHLSLKTEDAFLVVFLLSTGHARALVFHGRWILFLHLEASLLLLLNEIRNGWDSLGSHGALFDVGVVSEHLAEEALLVEGLDSLNYLAFRMVALLH
jgi:hypothetical protein